MKVLTIAIIVSALGQSKLYGEQLRYLSDTRSAQYDELNVAWRSFLDQFEGPVRANLRREFNRAYYREPTVANLR